MVKPTGKTALKRPASQQDEQKRLMKQAAKQSGVAETIEAYGRLARYGGSIKSDLPVIRYGTGGNLISRSR
jgi:hypothetical protein